jgi:hypothetical protein
MSVARRTVNEFAKKIGHTLDPNFYHKQDIAGIPITGVSYIQGSIFQTTVNIEHYFKCINCKYHLSYAVMTNGYMSFFINTTKVNLHIENYTSHYSNLLCERLRILI